MPSKKYNVVVKKRTYTDREGKEKGVYVNVGSVMQGDDGSEYLLLNREFNPAGIPNPENRDTVLCSFYEPRNDAGQQDQHNQSKSNGYQRQPVDPNGFDDDIGF